MTQPKFAPIEQADEVRSAVELAAPPPWVTHRPGEHRLGAAAHKKGFGTPGPDQGYALLLVQGLADKFVLTEGEHRDDVIAGALVIALRRAALFGRAPVRADLELALHLFGFLGDATPALVTYRRARFSGIGHSYRAQRELADSVPASTLALSPAQVTNPHASWQELTGRIVTEEGG